MENPFIIKGYKPSRTQRTQVTVKEGMKKVGEVGSAISTGLLPYYHKS